MTIYDHTRNGRPVNPALALYKFWHTILVGTTPDVRDNKANHLRGSTCFGTDGWRISFLNDGPVETPEIMFGGSFQLNRKGEFKVRQPHGYHQRSVIARNTFLDWDHWRSQYHWFVKTDPGWHSHFGGHIADWREPRHYVSERVMGARENYWSQRRPWLKLAWSEEFGWHITHSRNEKPSHPQYQDSRGPITRADFARFDELRRRRYQLMERREKVASGEWTFVNRRVVTREEREARQDSAVQVIMANFVVTQTARTTPLRKRDREEEGLWPLPSGRP